LVSIKFATVKRHRKTFNPFVFLIDPSFVWTNESSSSDLGFMGPQVAAQVTKTKALSNNHRLYSYMNNSGHFYFMCIDLIRFTDYTARIELKLTSPGSSSSSYVAQGGSGSSSASSRSRLLAENIQTFYSDGSSNTFHVYFDQVQFKDLVELVNQTK
jgi:hypothetical protein